MTSPLIALIEDHPLLRDGFAHLLRRHGFESIAPPLGPLETLLDEIRSAQPNCVVVDLGLPYPEGGLSIVGPVASAGIAVVVLTAETDKMLWAACLRAGAACVLSKSEEHDVIVNTIASVCRGEVVMETQRSVLMSEALALQADESERMRQFRELTSREQEILAGLRSGLSAAEIAQRDFVSIQTVRTQIRSVLRKLGVRSQLEAVAAATHAGWTPSPSPSEPCCR